MLKWEVEEFLGKAFINYDTCRRWLNQAKIGSCKFSPWGQVMFWRLLLMKLLLVGSGKNDPMRRLHGWGPLPDHGWRVRKQGLTRRAGGPDWVDHLGRVTSNRGGVGPDRNGRADASCQSVKKHDDVREVEGEFRWMVQPFLQCIVISKAPDVSQAVGQPHYWV